MQYVIGVDGGGTKTDIVLCTEDGRIVKRMKVAGSNHQIIGCEKAIHILKDGIDRIIAENLSDGDRVAQITCGLAGADFEEDVSLLTGELGRVLPGFLIEVLTDVWLPLATEAPDGPAAVSICGTGHNTALRLKNGTRRQISALDFVLGNGNGGNMICDIAFHYACRAAEFTGPATRLSEELPKIYRQPDMLSLLKWMYLNKKAGIRDSHVPRLVCSLAADGDEVSEKILKKVAARQAEMTLGLIRHDHMENDCFPVVLAGSVYLGDESHIVRDRYCEVLQDGCPGADVIVSDTDPVAGAVMMALVSIGAYSSDLHDKIVKGIETRM